MVVLREYSLIGGALIRHLYSSSLLVSCLPCGFVLYVLKRSAHLSNMKQAVNALDGSSFNGNAVVARFYDLEKFETGALDFTATERMVL
jgi:hypothetical protein